jgi:probable selenium-dependent hydroxylase accessory protein YqeC
MADGIPNRLCDALLLHGGGVVSLVGAGGKTSLMYRLARELAGTGQAVLTTTTTRIYPPEADQCGVCILAPTAGQILARAAGALREHRHLTAAAGRSAESGKLSGLAAGEIDRLCASRVFDWIIVEADGAAGRPLKAPAAHEPVIPSCSGWLVGVAGLQAVGKPLTDRWVFRPEAFARLTGLRPGASINAQAVAAALAHEHGVLKGAPAGCRCLAFLNQADVSDGQAAGLGVAAALKRIGAGRIRRAIIGQVRIDPPVLAVCDLP